MTFDLTGKTALVTGASKGIGRAIALGLAQAGADLAIAARDVALLESLAKEAESLGRRVLVLPTDVTDAEAIRAGVERALSELGGVDILVNNAGGNTVSAPFVSLRESAWTKVMRLNFDSIVTYCQAVGPHMIERGSGSVINISSVAGLEATPFMAHYAAAKAAVISLTKTMAMEWAWSGVRVNALCPGWIDTDLTDFLTKNPDSYQATADQVPLKRWGQAQEMAGPAIFLASDAASYVTGHILVADGGLSQAAG